jgi:CheY-like chemotaxis protein
LRAPPTILVVEDEVLVRLAIADYLRYCGFKVVEAGDGAESIAIIRSGIALDLVFSDVRLAYEDGGLELESWIKRHHPRLNVILTSGHVDAAKKAAALCPERQLMAKPYTHEEVVARIRSLLATRDAAVAAASK